MGKKTALSTKDLCALSLRKVCICLCVPSRLTFLTLGNYNTTTWKIWFLLCVGSGPRCVHTGARITGSCPTPRARPQACIGRMPHSLGLCAKEFMHSPETITKQPEDAPHLPCCMSRGSSRFEVDDRGTRGFRAPHKWECLTLYVKHCGIQFPHDLCVASLTHSCRRGPPLGGHTGVFYFDDENHRGHSSCTFWRPSR